MHNDIPEAQRQQVPSRKPKPALIFSPLLLIGGLVGLIGILGGAWMIFRAMLGNPDNSPSDVADSTAAAGSNPNIFGHHPFEEADQSELTALRTDPNIQLRFSAAEAFESMVYDAEGAGINLVALSGFRTREDQEFLFFKVKESRNQNASQRAEVSAPPGHSEHHTGFALDIGDGNAPETHVEVDFAQTEAFEWLTHHAARYSFELSFPEGNEQGVSYEPWHWRFVGDQVSLEIFHKGR